MPSHVNASRTAAIVERSLLAAERSVWVAGVVVVGDAVQREVVWPASVVVAVDMWMRDLLGEVDGEDQPRVDDGWSLENLCQSEVLRVYVGRAAIEATLERCTAKSRNQGQNRTNGGNGAGGGLL